MNPSTTTAGPNLEYLLEEFAARLEAGEPEDVAAFAAAHPEHADQLQRVLPTMLVLKELGQSASASSAAPPPVTSDGQPATGVLGDFRIVREVGRGGMGIVYEAEQISLGRRVALKVLPLAATMDSRHLQRFHNEARAAACLHHGHIVPVYYVGCERGVHFYAMQLIEGQTLAAVIREMRTEPISSGTGTAETPPRAALTTERSRQSKEYYRKVAALGVQAAEALDYAHERGVIHRDVKPGNLMLDAEGALWVTDFGLAQLQHSEASLTLTGDLVGTLRYMSPEQAMAKRVVIDHRTDVYSLGVTLYELLTLRPAFTGQDRQELLRQVAFDDPTAPRKLDRAIPAELETIVLKAIEKNPTERYATAQEMADDLRRFLEDRPIKARRPSLRQTAAKWARRHRPLVGTAAVALLLTVLLGGAVAIWWLQTRALAQGQAREALAEAERLGREERWSEAVSAAKRAKGVVANIGADAALMLAIEELAKDLTMAIRLQEARLEAARLKDGTWDWASANAAYIDAFAWYGLDVVSASPPDAAQFILLRFVRPQLAAALDDWAYVRRQLGDHDWTCLTGLADVADPDPWRRRLRALESSNSKGLEALVASTPGDELAPETAVLLARLAEGTPAARRAHLLLQQVQRRHPADFWVNHQLGKVADQPDEALRYCTAAVALRPQSAGARHNLGNALRRNGMLEAAMAEHLVAIRLAPDCASAHNNLGVVLREMGRLDDAIREYSEAIRLRPNEATAHSNLGAALTAKGDVERAIAACREAIRLKPSYAEAHDNLGAILCDVKHEFVGAITEFREALRLKPDSTTYVNLGIALEKSGKPDDAIAQYRRAVHLKENDSKAHARLGMALLNRGAADEAIAECERAIRLQHGNHEAHWSLGNALRVKGQVDNAISAYQHAIELKPDYADAYLNLGAILCDVKGNYDGALAAFREAIRLKPEYAPAHFDLGLALLHKGQFRQAAAAFRSAHALETRTAPSRSQSTNALGRAPPSVQTLVAAVRHAERLAAVADRLADVLAGKSLPKDAAERLGFAVLCQQHGQRFVAAARFYEEAFAAKPALADDLGVAHRYNAACAAALAGCAQGEGAAKLPDIEKRHLRNQSLTWLRAEIDRLAKKSQAGHPDVLVLITHMAHAQKDPDFNGVRESLAALPASEHAAWRELWADVERLLKQARAGLAQTTLKGSLTDGALQQTHTQPMEAGRTYVIDMQSAAFDTFLKLVDSKGTLVAENDDIGTNNLNSRIVFTPAGAGPYRIVATSFQERGRGAYTLTITTLSARKEK